MRRFRIGLDRPRTGGIVVIQKTEDTDSKGEFILYEIRKNDISIADGHVRPLSEEGDGPWIGGLKVNPFYQGRGYAVKILAAICRDYAGQTIRLRAKPYGHAGMDSGQLRHFYKRLGFVGYDTSGRMFKTPKTTQELCEVGERCRELGFEEHQVRKVIDEMADRTWSEHDEDGRTLADWVWEGYVNAR